MSREYFLIVHTDTYTGNIDSFLSGLLFNVDDDRYGWEQGSKLAKKLGIEPAAVDLDIHKDARYEMSYNLHDADTNSLEFAIYCRSEEQLENYRKGALAKLKKDWEGVKIEEDRSEYIDGFTILGFSVREDITETKITAL